MDFARLLAALEGFILLVSGSPVNADGPAFLCVSATFPASSSARMIGSASVPSMTRRVFRVTCHVGQARTGGLSGTIGLAEDPFALLGCLSPDQADHEDISTLSDESRSTPSVTSIFFKRTHIYRIIDRRSSSIGDQRPDRRRFSPELDLDGPHNAVALMRGEQRRAMAAKPFDPASFNRPARRNSPRFLGNAVVRKRSAHSVKTIVAEVEDLRQAGMISRAIRHEDRCSTCFQVTRAMQKASRHEPSTVLVVQREQVQVLVWSIE